MTRRRPLALALLSLLPAAGLTGCIAPPTSADRLTDAAYEMNMATRFGRMDVALSYIGPKARKQFVATHAPWGRAIRIADLEFAGVDMPNKDEATVLVHVSWQRIDESTLRTTSILQTWKELEDSGWLIVDEKRVGGDSGLVDAPGSALHEERTIAADVEGEAEPVGEVARASAGVERIPGGAPDAPPPPSAAPTAPPSPGRFSTIVIPASDDAM
jgi:hypothetical protein